MSSPPRVESRGPGDLRRFDELADQWWRPAGPFAALHWLADARARLVPPATRPGAVLVDVGCGAGLLAPHLAGKGYQHVGVDLLASALAQAAARGVRPVIGDAAALPLATGSADVVVAGELLEHVTDLDATVGELCRVLRPGGRLIVDTLNATAISKLLTITVAECFPTVPSGLHDADRYVDPARLAGLCARHGVRLRVRGARPTLWGALRWLLTGRGTARIVPTWSTAVLYQGVGVKSERAVAPARDRVASQA